MNAWNVMMVIIFPSNFRNKTKCTNCPIEGCKNCDNKGICQKCNIDYEPTIKDGVITSCTSKCELGKDDRCLTCDAENGNKKCSSCNAGYKLMKNGSCKKIENSFIAKYKVNSTNMGVVSTQIPLPGQTS